MTKISHIVSSDLLDLIDGRDFYMCLANIASKDKNYCDFYKKQVEKGAFVLLDNGAAEADQMDLQTMWSVIEKINPSEVILSDSLLNCDETLSKSKKALEFYKSKGYKGQFMFVPQGSNFAEWTLCYDTFDKSQIDTIGVSKFVTSGWNDSNARKSCCDYIDGRQPIHLLGCHENINEVATISKYCKNIRSNDTAIAYIYALANQHINEGNRPLGEINFIKSDLTPEQVELLKQNIKTFDETINNTRAA